MAVKIRETVETRMGPGRFTVRLKRWPGVYHVERETRRLCGCDERGAGGLMPSELFVKCAVVPAITSRDLAGLTSEEFGELWDI
jgi:hypothetical protein